MSTNDVTGALKEMSAAGENTFRAVFVFNDELDIFKGHFPGNPLLPGIVQIEMVKQAAEKALGYECVLEEVSRAKFMGPVRPGDEVSAEVRLGGNDDMIKAAVQISTGGERKSSITVILRKREGMS